MFQKVNVCFITFTMVSLASEAPKQLDPLVVTGEKDSGSFMTRHDLDFFQARSVTDLSGLVPGLFVVSSDGGGYGNIISMRGSSNTLYFSPPAVGMMVDDVPLGEVSSYPVGLLQSDRVAVLRGPQGTIFGLNGAAGMIEMSSPRPGKQLKSEVTTEYGSYDARGARFQTAGPLNDDWSQTFQLYHQERDGYMHNTTLGGYPDDRSVSGGLANLYWKPSDDSELRLRVFAEHEDDGSQRLSLLSSRDPFSVASDIAGESVIDRQQVSLHWTKTGTWGTLKSITAWQYWQLDPCVTDLDLRNTPGFGPYSTIVQDQRLWSQEIRWESPEDASPWSWRTGVFFMDQASTGDTVRALGGPYSEMIDYQLDQSNLAAYGRASYAFNDQLKVLVGARIDYIDSRIDREKTTNYTMPIPALLDTMDDVYFSPEIGASYALNQAVRLFARSSIGIKPAGFSAFANNPAQARYDDESAWCNEAGFELTLPEHHLSMTVTGYLNQIHDYQVNRPDIYTTDYFTVNAEQATSIGLESEIKWHPIEHLTVQGAVSVVHTEFDQYVDPLLAGIDYNGNRAPFVPDFTGSLGIRYDFTCGFYAQTTVRMTGSTYFNEANDHQFKQASYLCWDAEFGYLKNGFSIALFGRNMLDEEYYTYINSQLLAGSPGDPQVFGVRAAYAF